MISLDVDFLFETAGGPIGLQRLLERHVPDCELEYATVQMWAQRATIPGRMIPAVLYAMHREGHENLLLFFTDDRELTADPADPADPCGC